MTQTDKLVQLRKLHSIPDQRARYASLAVEISGLSLLAAGLWGILSESGRMLMNNAVGCLLGVGIMLLGNPIYHWVVARQRRRIAPEILRISEELLD